MIVVFGKPAIGYPDKPQQPNFFITGLFRLSLVPALVICTIITFLPFQKQNVIGSTESMPSTSTVSRRALDDVHAVIVKHVREEISKASPFGCVALDSWSCKYRGNGYFTSKYHALTGKLLVPSTNLKLTRLGVCQTVSSRNRLSSLNI